MLEFLASHTWLVILIYILIAGFIFWFRAFPFREKRSDDPQRTTHARLTRRYIKSGADRSGRSRVGFNHVLVFTRDDDTQVELYAYEEEYGALREGMEGHLTWQGKYYVDFRQDVRREACNG